MQPAGAPPIPYVPVDGRPWRLTMGLRPLDEARWLEVDDRRGDELRLKQSLLADDPGGVVAVLPGSETAGRELLDAVVGHLGRYHPTLAACRDDGSIVERTTGARVDASGLHPVDAAARLVQEDLCLMADTPAGWVLCAASVCFPSRWRLADKLGRDLAAIHGPVPGYATSLDDPVRRFFDRLRPDRPVWRLNWSLLDSPELHQPRPDGRLAGRLPAAARLGDELWFRVERQTLRRLPGSGAVAFTIRTYVCSLESLVRSHPDVAAALAATLATVPDGPLRYKGWTELVGPLRAWLAGRVATEDPDAAGPTGGALRP